MQTGNCFRCRQAGHWINDCPLKSNADDPPPSIHCPCGGGICEIKVSNTQENPARRFYKCPAAQNCRFFKWYDKVTDEDIRFRPAFTIPNCPCGSGPCRRVIADSGPNAGRAHLQCGIKKGFGACGFFKWEDVEMPPSCDAADEIDFWVAADQISSDVESSFHASGVPDNANQVATLGKEGQGSANTEDDSILENLDDMSVSDIHSAAVNQGASGINNFDSFKVLLCLEYSFLSFHLLCYLLGIPLSDPVVVEPEEQWMNSLHDEQPTSCALSKLSVDEAISNLVRDTVSSGAVMKHKTKNHEKPGTSEAEWSFPNLQDLMEQYNSEKLQLESISGKHVQVLSAFMSSYSRLRLLHEKASHLRKLLLETEKEMACCEAETLEYGTTCREVAGEMAESQKRMQETADKLGKEAEVLKQKEFADMKRRRI